MVTCFGQPHTCVCVAADPTHGQQHVCACSVRGSARIHARLAWLCRLIDALKPAEAGVVWADVNILVMRFLREHRRSAVVSMLAVRLSARLSFSSRCSLGLDALASRTLGWCTEPRLSARDSMRIHINSRARKHANPRHHTSYFDSCIVRVLANRLRLPADRVCGHAKNV
jgi:hypothetical protein